MQSGNKIWPVYVVLENKFLHQKLYKKSGLETSFRPFLILCKNDSEDVNMLIWTYFDSFAITYRTYVVCFKNLRK